MSERKTLQEADFVHGKILPLLLRFAGPVLLALALQATYGAVDVWVVGQYAATADVSAVATGSQLMFTATVIITGLSMGATVLLAQHQGSRQKQQSREADDWSGHIVGSAICLFALLALALTLIMELAAEPLSRLMQAPEAAFSRTVGYVRICSGGMLFIIAYNLLGSIFRGLGDSRTPLLAVSIACAGNIAGDLLLVAVFHLGAAGAAIATVASQALSVLCCLWVIRRRGLPFPLEKRHLRFEKKAITSILRLGLPMAVQDGLVSFSFMAMIAIVNSLGLVASAGVGVAEKLCNFIMLVPSAAMQSLSAFVGQNIGAGRPDRARKAMYSGMLASLAFGLVLAWLSYFHGDLLSSIFDKDPQVVAAAWDYLRAYAIDTLLVAFLFCFLGYFNGYGKTGFVLVQGLIGAFLVRIPFSYLMSLREPASLFLVGLGTPLSTVVQISLCLLYMALLRKKEQESGLFSSVS